ncbi:LacI family DNA-binding transcriptional regulator [Microbacterium sp. ZXX196]|uniref:LacI family DNA-binding transcriptional regulator n=1 Tax=Microbacterium sp. ZXX196 TaxID=2609291 RepID=UPI0012B877AC|nr:LacI family DNA-binding transcriptional regulator [Microbacterium sp. ZXX196]MTE22801.1 LacI family DNA-binding transcriptional regulator [Microbacterium sp. ZXX196]
MTGKRARRTPARETTISDIAEAAGVSKATVSRVMNGVATVGEDIAERVRRAVEELGYTRSETARSLSLGVSRTIGVVVPDLANPMFHQVLHGLHRAAAREDYRVLIADTLEKSAGEAAVVVDVRNRTDAVVLFAPRMTREELDALLPRVAPVVVLNRTTGERAGSVLVDYEAGVRELAEHLVDRGHRRLAYLAGPPESRSNEARQRGLESVRADRADVEVLEIPCGHAFADGHAAWPAVRASGATAVVAFNDVVALGLLGRLAEEGVRVPGDLAVAGFDDIPFAQFSSPSLTTMTARLAEIGERLWETLRAEMRGEADRTPVIFAPELAPRASTGGPA